MTILVTSSYHVMRTHLSAILFRHAGENVVYEITAENIFSVKGIFPYRTHIGKITCMLLLLAGIL